MEWHVTGVRRWLPVLLLVSLTGSTAGPVLRLASGAPGRPGDPRWLDVVFAVLGIAGTALVAVVAVVTWRTVVSLTPDGIVVGGGRRKFYPYAEITRVYRDRWTPGAVSLMLTGDRTARLPAPVAGFERSSPVLDEALEQIRARLPAPTPG